MPYLAVCSTAVETTYHVIVEREPMCELTSFGSAIIHMMGSYYMYNIQYPKSLYSLLIMVQHHIFGIDDTRDTPTVVETVTSLKNMDKT